MNKEQSQFLEVSGVWKYIDGIAVLQGIDLIQGAHQNLGIAGETGSGKSSLLKIIAGLMEADRGTVFFQNERILGPNEKLIAGHKSIAYLSQHFELRNHYRVEELMEMAMQVDPEIANRIFSLCQVEHLLKRRTDRLSGGEKQRIAIARLLITFPKLLILDEPYSNLDHAHKNIMKSVLRSIDEELNISCILVSHDPADLLSWADTIIVMKDGMIVQQAEPRMVYEQPINEYVATLFGKINRISINNHEQLVRPEQLIIGNGHPSTLSGIVQSVKYYGSYYELEIDSSGNMLTVRSAHGAFDIGQQVSLSLSPSKP